MKKAFVIVLVSAFVLSLGFCANYFWWNVNVGGRLLPRDSEEIVLKSGDFSDTKELISMLRPFRRLKRLTLEDARLEASEAEQLQKALPETEIQVEIFRELFGKEFSLTSETLDFSGVEITDLALLKQALPSFKRLAQVKSETQTFTPEQKADLKSSFSDVHFDLVALIDVYGTSFPDDVQKLDLTAASLDDGLHGILASFPRLKEVDLHGADLTDEEKHELVKAFPAVTFGWEVKIAGNSYDSLTEDLDLSEKKNLSRQTLLRKLPLFARLRRVDLSDCGLDEETLVSLRSDFPSVKIVWRIKMGQWSLKTDAVAFSVLIYNYEHERLKTEDIQVLKYCTDLQALDLGHQAIRDISVIGEYLKELRILILADNLVYDLSPLQNLKHLHYLELFVNGGFSDLTPLSYCRELVDLNISYSYRVSNIEPIMDLPLLERLWLEHTRVSKTDVARLRERYPDAEIFDVGEGSIDNGWRTHPRYFAMIDMFHKKNYISDEFSRYDNRSAPFEKPAAATTADPS